MYMKESLQCCTVLFLAAHRSCSVGQSRAQRRPLCESQYIVSLSLSPSLSPFPFSLSPSLPTSIFLPLLCPAPLFSMYVTCVYATHALMCLSTVYVYTKCLSALAGVHTKLSADILLHVQCTNGIQCIHPFESLK